MPFLTGMASFIVLSPKGACYLQRRASPYAN